MPFKASWFNMKYPFSWLLGFIKRVLHWSHTPTFFIYFSSKSLLGVFKEQCGERT